MYRETSQVRSPRKVICAFYASTTYASEYRAGLEFIQFAATIGFDLAIIADLENNDSAEKLESVAPGIRVIRIPSLIKKQSNLYRLNDFLPQIIWHHQVSKWLRKHTKNTECVWVQNGAAPWLPISNYFGLAPLFVWGPVGGGEPPSPMMMQELPLKTRIREKLRSWIETSLLRHKRIAIHQNGAPKIVAMARTSEAQRQLRNEIGWEVPVIPEILDPLKEMMFTRLSASRPRFIWVGQDIPRKNLRLSLEIFSILRQGAFPDATLDIFGCAAPATGAAPGVIFHGWVPKIEWGEFSESGVLLLTSFREGLPSVVLEALRNGLLCITSDVGAIGKLDVETVFTLPRDEYPAISDQTVNALIEKIKNHLQAKKIKLNSVSYRQKLMQHLMHEGVLPRTQENRGTEFSNK